jgi:hypothetical protein
MTRTGRLFLLSPLLLVLVFGCKASSTPARVAGKFTYKGNPVPAGSVTFHMPEGGIFSYPLNSDGTFSGSDLPAGEMVVTVETESANPKGRSVQYKGRGQGKEGGDPSVYMKKMKEMGKVPEGAANAGEYVKIPLKYARKETSPLKVTLTRGKNDCNFELTD